MPSSCNLYRDWKSRLNLSMRQTHRAGNKLFIDYCGPTVPIINAITGEERRAQIFVAVMGASNYAYVEATWSQTLPDWIRSHTRAFSYSGGVTSLLVPDNLRSGVSKACCYEPVINVTYAEMAAHYDTAILPARPKKPRDKPKVENGVCHHGLEQPQPHFLRRETETVTNSLGQGGSQRLARRSALQHPTPQAHSARTTPSVKSIRFAFLETIISLGTITLTECFLYGSLGRTCSMTGLT